jgi:hypothetical protein
MEPENQEQENRATTMRILRDTLDGKNDVKLTEKHDDRREVLDNTAEVYLLVAKEDGQLRVVITGPNVPGHSWTWGPPDPQDNQLADMPADMAKLAQHVLDMP